MSQTLRQMDSVHLTRKEDAQFSGDLVVGDEQAVVVGERDQVAVEQPMDGP